VGLRVRTWREPRTLLHKQAGARVRESILRVLREHAKQEERLTARRERVRRDRAEGPAFPVQRERGQRTLTFGAQKPARGAAGSLRSAASRACAPQGIRLVGRGHGSSLTARAPDATPGSNLHPGHAPLHRRRRPRAATLVSVMVCLVFLSASERPKPREALRWVKSGSYDGTRQHVGTWLTTRWHRVSSGGAILRRTCRLLRLPRQDVNYDKNIGRSRPQLSAPVKMNQVWAARALA